MRIKFSILFSLIAFALSAQKDSTSFFKDNVEIGGYVKYMETFSGDTTGNIFTQSLIHNRINSKVYINDNHVLHLELRNRLFYGEMIKLNPFFIDALEIDGGVVDMAWAGGENRSIIWSSKIDRLWYKGDYKSWEWSLGRQRINWGINNFWNSNDLFNAFNFTDFDYEERPGVDAARIQKWFKDDSSIEVAFGAYANNQYVSALKYAWNKWDYDFQLIGAKYFNDYALAVGWAGNIKKLGFKGEAAYFHPDSLVTDTTGIASISISFEYLLEGGKFLSFGGLLNTGGISNQSQISPNLLGFQTSAKMLMPTKYNAMVAFGGQLNDLSTYNVVAMYSPGLDMVLLMPSINYSISQNLDLSAFIINFLTQFNGQWVNGSNAFLRAKYSF